MTSYNPDSVARYFDAFGDREWTRLVETPAAEVKLHVHAHYLRRHVTPGMRVLDIGAGAGRFTAVLATLGASVTVADISPVQVNLNEHYATVHGFVHAVTDRMVADICDLSAFPEAAFDTVVCYGGPLSYVFERGPAALRELLRVTAPGGPLCLSVMSLWGSIHEKLPGVLATDATENARIIATGDLRLGADDGTRHQCHLYRADEFRELLEATGGELVALSASNTLSTGWSAPLDAIRADPVRWEALLAMEVEAGAQPGCWDLGTHLIAIVRRPVTPRLD